MSFTMLREFSASGDPEIVSAPVVRHTPEEKHLVLRAVYVTTVSGVIGMPDSSAERFLYGEVWDKLTELELNFDGKKYPFTDEPLGIAGTRTAFMDTWKCGDWSQAEKFDMGKYQDIVRRAKSRNVTESDRVTQKWMTKECVGEDFFISDSMIGRCPRVTRSGDKVYIIIGCRLPVILRPTEATGETKTFTLVGMCYAHGIMDGEWIDKTAKAVQSVLRHKKDMSSDDFLKFLLLPGVINAWTEDITLI